MLDEFLLTKNQTIAVALSGGKDSVCLLHMLLAVKDKLSLNIKAINVEHGIRGASSLADTAFCKMLCDRYGIELKLYSVDSPKFATENGVSEETAARILRYQCFDNALIDGFCDKIATAHHMSDSVETILFNLFRGTSAKGMCGIEKTAKGGKIIRPLLSVTREQIDEYAKNNKLEFVTDESNFSNEYSRNYIRNVVLPDIKMAFPSAEANIARFATLLSEENTLLDRLAERYIDGNKVLFPEEGDVLFRRACLIVMKKAGFAVDYEAVHLKALCNLKNLQCGASASLKNGLVATRTKDGVVFEKKPTKVLDEIPFSLGSHKIGRYIVTFEKADYNTDNKADGFLYFDLDKLPYNTVIRTKRDGDMIVVFGGKTKKLKKYLNDKKIESRLSASYPLLALNSEVYAVCNLDIGEKIKISEETVNTVRINITDQGDNNA